MISFPTNHTIKSFNQNPFLGPIPKINLQAESIRYANTNSHGGTSTSKEKARPSHQNQPSPIRDQGGRESIRQVRQNPLNSLKRRNSDKANPRSRSCRRIETASRPPRSSQTKEKAIRNCLKTAPGCQEIFN